MLKDCLDDGVEVTFSKIIKPSDCNYGKYLITMTTCNRRYKVSRFITENEFLYLHERVDQLYKLLKRQLKEIEEEKWIR